MMTPRERYDSDPLFRTMVHTFMKMYEQQNSSGAGLTPTEVREAAGFAWQIYSERHAFPPMIIRTPDDQRP